MEKYEHLEDKFTKGESLTAFDKDMSRYNNVAYILTLKEDDTSYKLYMHKYRTKEDKVLIEEVSKDNNIELDTLGVEDYLESVRGKVYSQCK